MINYKNRNTKVLADFVAYCKANPELRFWQALRNWSGYGFIEVTNDTIFVGKGNRLYRDTFYWEGKRHDSTNV